MSSSEVHISVVIESVKKGRLATGHMVYLSKGTDNIAGNECPREVKWTPSPRNPPDA